MRDYLFFVSDQTYKISRGSNKYFPKHLVPNACPVPAFHCTSLVDLASYQTQIQNAQ